MSTSSFLVYTASPLPNSTQFNWVRSEILDKRSLDAQPHKPLVPAKKFRRQNLVVVREYEEHNNLCNSQLYGFHTSWNCRSSKLVAGAFKLFSYRAHCFLRPGLGLGALSLPLLLFLHLRTYEVTPGLRPHSQQKFHHYSSRNVHSLLAPLTNKW